MKKKTDKEQLFERLGKIDPTFKKRIDETWDREDEEFEKYPGEFKEAKQKLLSAINSGKIWDELEFEEYNESILPLDDYVYSFHFDDRNDDGDYEFAYVSLSRKGEKGASGKLASVVDLASAEEFSKDFIKDIEQFNYENIREYQSSFEKPYHPADVEQNRRFPVDYPGKRSGLNEEKFFQNINSIGDFEQPLKHAILLIQFIMNDRHFDENYDKATKRQFNIVWDGLNNMKEFVDKERKH